MAICDLDVAPAFERSKHHEEIGGAIALVLVIETGRASRFHRDRHARFGNELLRGLVEANQRTIAVSFGECSAGLCVSPHLDALAESGRGLVLTRSWRRR